MSATYGDQRAETYKAAADLRNVIYHIVRFAGLSAPGGPPSTNIASHAAATFALGPVGVLQNAPGLNQHATVAWLGRSKVVAGGTVTAGQLVTCNASGRAANASGAGSGDIVIGRALTTATTDGELISVLLGPPFRMSGSV